MLEADMGVRQCKPVWDRWMGVLQTDLARKRKLTRGSWRGGGTLKHLNSFFFISKLPLQTLLFTGVFDTHKKLL